MAVVSMSEHEDGIKLASIGEERQVGVRAVGLPLPLSLFLRT